MTTIDKETLRAKCLATTPGPWWATDAGVRDIGGYICLINKTTRYPNQGGRYEKELAERKANADFIAASSDVVLSLLDEIEVLRAKNEDVFSTIQQVQGNYLKALDENKALRDALTKSMQAMNMVHNVCETFSHIKRHQHKLAENCEPVAIFSAAINQARAALAQGETK
jgi:hypothetical protein